MEEIQGRSCIGHKCNCHNHLHTESHHNHSHHEREELTGWKPYIAMAISFALMASGMIIDHFHGHFFTDNFWVKPLWYFVAFLPVGIPVLKEAIEGVGQKDYFNELTLMSIACIGAFLIGEYSEAVGVMLFYCLGETLQDRAVDKATKDISKLLDIRPEKARVIKDGVIVIKKPQHVHPGEIIEIHPGERVPLDGVLESDEGIFDTAALTGESMPRNIEKGGEVLAGMISSLSTIRIKVNKEYGDSALSRILDLVKNAQARKAHSEVFIRKFARIYTPIVCICALLVLLVPCFIGIVHPTFHYDFSVWLYRALIFLVISCPCALVISVPLSYFAGIGAASKAGILFKGGNYLEAITRVNTIAFDKTGTLTTGRFSVEKVKSYDINEDEMLSYIGAAESKSSHPLAKTIIDYIKIKGINIPKVEKMEEIAGKGVKASIDDKIVLAGNLRLMQLENIVYPEELNSNYSTIVACAVDGIFKGYIMLADTIKDDSIQATKELENLKMRRIIMLSGDRKEIVSDYAAKLGIKEYHGELLPADKANFVEKISKDPTSVIAFVGDGMNDAPVLTLSNVGIAMGGLGSDAAIESADVVIQTDKPSKVATAIKIGRYTHTIVKENIVGALAIKITILVLGLLGIASLWAAVFADVGVTMLAVLNSMRIMWKKY